MNIYQCQKMAKDVGFDSSTFIAMFPRGPTKCKWLDAYMGLFTVDLPGMDGKFLTVDQIDTEYPDLVVTEPLSADGK